MKGLLFASCPPSLFIFTSVITFIHLPAYEFLGNLDLQRYENLTVGFCRLLGSK